MYTLIRAGLALSAGILLAAPLFAQESRAEVTATYNGLVRPASEPANAPKNSFSYEYANRESWLNFGGRKVVGDKSSSPAVGILAWTVPPEQFGTGGMDREFRGYCSEAPVPVTAGRTYRFEIKSPTVPEAYQLPDTEDGKAEAYRRSLYLRELFGKHYIPSLTDYQASKAFQIAMWEIFHETGWAADKAPPLDLDKGSFKASAQQADPETVNLARTYLKSLTGNDNVFYENPDLAGRELVWMKGLESPQPDGPPVVAQSQSALQYVKGGAARPSNAGLTGAPVGAGGVVPLAGGAGGAFAGGAGGTGGFIGGAGLGSSGVPSTTTPPTTTTTPPTTNVPPVNQPPTNPPETPTNPVPAPAGIVLGAIAVGALFGRKVLTTRR